MLLLLLVHHLAIVVTKYLAEIRIKKNFFKCYTQNFILQFTILMSQGLKNIAYFS